MVGCMTGAATTFQDAILPPLRKDLGIFDAPPGEDGAPSWLLFDPLANAYYRIGQAAFTIMSQWKEGMPLGQWLEQLREQDRSIDEDTVEHCLGFLRSRGLTAVSDDRTRAVLEKQHQMINKPKNWLVRLLSHYLFFRVPLLNPDPWLTRTLPWAQFFFHPLWRWSIRILGLAGIIMILRQWELFLNTIPYFFTLPGAIVFAVSLFMVKALHELGHAYRAKQLGCRVPVMGMAFFLFYPLFYTDTTDAWRLSSPHQRLAIAAAGIKAELSLAFMACFAWNFLEDGMIRSLMFIIATTSIISSLAINLMPFMRFDGYYALSDILHAENLQPRAFALGKWQLRTFLFGPTTPPPESLPKARRTTFIAYAFGTWIYRFFLFTGIGLMVYHFAFKTLGVLLFAFAVHRLIIHPVWKEIQAWKSTPGLIRPNLRLFLIIILLGSLILAALVPWNTRVIMPAVLEADHTGSVFTENTGLLQAVHVTDGQIVKQGDLLFEITMPELETRAAMLSRRADYLQIRLNRYMASHKDLEQLDILAKQWTQVQTDLDGLKKRMGQGRITAPCDGRVTRLTQHPPGQWIPEKALMAKVISPQWTLITAYLHEDQLSRIQIGAKARFYDELGTHSGFDARVTDISATAISALPHGELGSVHGGPVAVRPVSENDLRPEGSFYQVSLETQSPVTHLFHRTAGRVRVQASAESPLAQALKYALSVWIRESEL